MNKTIKDLLDTVYRVTDKTDLLSNGVKCTVFRVYKRSGDSFVYDGQWSCPGHGKSDYQCLKAYLDE